MFQKHKIAIIGAGKMGGAMARALRAPAYDRDTNLNTVLGNKDVIIFAVKPQDFESCMNGITVDISKKLIVSIMAGVTLKKLAKKTNAKKIVRAMPNLGAQVGKSVTIFTSTQTVMKNERLFIQKLFSSIGMAIEVPSESLIDSLIAINGCGPAYFFLLCEMLQQEAEKMGLSSKEAEQMAKFTFFGSAKLLEKSDQSVAWWRQAVTSKKGVTEAALKCLQKYGFSKIFAKAISAAQKRTKELSQ